MTNLIKLGAVSAVALMLAAPAFSQAALVGTEALDDRIDDIQEDVADEFDKSVDADRYGANQFPDGWTGGVSLGFAATSGNTDTADLSVGGRFRYGNGPWNHTFGFGAEFGESDGVKSKEEVFSVYDVNRYFTDRFYVFGLASIEYDRFATNELDAFVGVGPGYRVVATEDATWRVQAGPGVRFTRDQLGNEETEGAGLLSSRVYYKISDTVFLSNDTDVLFSEGSNLATNDIGVNFKVSDKLATRVGYRTEYNSEPLAGYKKSDNTLGVSLVYGF
ncbi:DUF481 domain-containing protein [Alphaproteobacteria bacterium KMM 3653]|uniref:DUF481 domain-containing protein n=1 Tax=Harenicola maris TaxID=2841044 RepID=A0AAP2CTA9_9RHOB|nr:DUF481 domain-containing protein [Harenicola maris]